MNFTKNSCNSPSASNRHRAHFWAPQPPCLSLNQLRELALERKGPELLQQSEPGKLFQSKLLTLFFFFVCFLFLLLEYKLSQEGNFFDDDSTYAVYSALAHKHSRKIHRQRGKEEEREGWKERTLHLHFSRGWRENRCFPCSTAPLQLGKVRRKDSLFCRLPERCFLAGSLADHRNNQIDAVLLVNS